MSDFSRQDRFSRKGEPAQRLRVISSDFETAALLWCILWPADAADVVTAGWFRWPAYREAYEALAASMTLHEALDLATPRAAFLIRRLIP